ncbi:translesion error-prone DNA polymerase V autoproteolytic subunit [Cyanobium sp. HWJ4-Hawea]|nr:translesion error-prone DNA polymerase V autoproteolytic subunit [Cyanobium sp. HWJ4-Hawea]
MCGGAAGRAGAAGGRPWRCAHAPAPAAGDRTIAGVAAGAQWPAGLAEIWHPEPAAHRADCLADRPPCPRGGGVGAAAPPAGGGRQLRPCAINWRFGPADGQHPCLDALPGPAACSVAEGGGYGPRPRRCAPGLDPALRPGSAPIPGPAGPARPGASAGLRRLVRPNYAGRCVGVHGVISADLVLLGPPLEELEELLLPLATETVSAGFPSPAADYVDGSIDLNVALMPHPSSTFFMRVEGEAMRAEGIHHGDLLVIDRSVVPVAGSTVVAVHQGEFLLRRLEGGTSRWRLEAADGHTAPIALQGEDPDLLIWGVVIHAVHHLLPRR